MQVPYMVDGVSRSTLVQELPYMVIYPEPDMPCPWSRLLQALRLSLAAQTGEVAAASYGSFQQLQVKKPLAHGEPIALQTLLIMRKKHHTVQAQTLRPCPEVVVHDPPEFDQSCHRTVGLRSLHAGPA